MQKEGKYSRIKTKINSRNENVELTRQDQNTSKETISILVNKILIKDF